MMRSLLCLLALGLLPHASALTNPDLRVYIGYFTGKYYRNQIFVGTTAVSFPKSGWELSVSFWAWSVAASQNTANSGSTFTCFHPCQKTSPTLRSVFGLDGFATKGNGCDGSFGLQYTQPFCTTKDATNAERFTISYFKDPDDTKNSCPNCWDFMFVQKDSSKMIPQAEKGTAVGGYLSHPAPIRPQHNVPSSLDPKVNKWEVKFEFFAESKPSATCYAGYRLNAAGTFCEPCPTGYFRKLSAREADLTCTRCPMNSTTLVSGGVMSSQCICDGGFEGTADASKVGLAAKIGDYTTERFCAICQPGKYGQAGTDKCQDCDKGYYSAKSGSLTCTPTEIGYYQSATGQVKQLSCPPGQFNPATVMPKCLDCGPGTYSDLATQAYCKLCPLGTYSSSTGATACKTCSAQSSTLHPGSQSADACTTVTTTTVIATTVTPACPACPATTTVKTGDGCRRAEQGQETSKSTEQDLQTSKSQSVITIGAAVFLSMTASITNL